jgi:hypothetical protein
VAQDDAAKDICASRVRVFGKHPDANRWTFVILVHD